MRRLAPIAIACALALPAHAQLALGDMELGVGVGGMNYIGDLNNQGMLGAPHWAGGLFCRINWDNRWALVLGAAAGQVEGGSPDCMAWRNLSFRSPILEGTMRMEFNFWPYGQGDMRFRWTPFIFGGIGAFHFNPKALLEDPATHEARWHELQPLGTEGQGLEEYAGRTPYALTQLSMPFGLGVKWTPTKTVTLSAEYGFRKSWTDYLDDVSTTYADNALLRQRRGEVAAALADRSAIPNATGIKRGDDSLDDWYAYFNVSVSVSFDLLFGWMRKKRCD